MIFGKLLFAFVREASKGELLHVEFSKRNLFLATSGLLALFGSAKADFMISTRATSNAGNSTGRRGLFHGFERSLC